MVSTAATLTPVGYLQFENGAPSRIAFGLSVLDSSRDFASVHSFVFLCTSSL
jgi:hypothetical protein